MLWPVLIKIITVLVNFNKIRPLINIKELLEFTGLGFLQKPQPYIKEL